MEEHPRRHRQRRPGGHRRDDRLCLQRRQAVRRAGHLPRRCKDRQVHRVEFPEIHRPDDEGPVGRREGHPQRPQRPERRAGGRVFVSFSDKDAILVVDADTGKVVKRLSVPKPGDIEAASAEPGILRLQRHGGAERQRRHRRDPARGQSRRWEARIGSRPWVWTRPAISTRASAARTITCRSSRPDGKHAPHDRPQGRPDPARPLDARRHVQRQRAGRRQRRQALGGRRRRLSRSASASGTRKPGLQDGVLRLGVLRRPSARRSTPWIRTSWSARAANGRSIRRPAAPHASARSRATAWRSSRFGFGPNGKLYLATDARLPRHGRPCESSSAWATPSTSSAPCSAASRRTAPRRARRSASVEVWSDANDDGQEQPDEVKTYDVRPGRLVPGLVHVDDARHDVLRQPLPGAR